MATNWYSTREAADYLGISIASIKRYVYSGEIEYVQYAPYAPIRFSQAQLDAFIAAHTVRTFTSGDAA